ncbi:MAG TPA: hypothetical protein VF712_08425 [Thermoleophilaceae bacterium]|jgi:hypothetical protein
MTGGGYALGVGLTLAAIAPLVLGAIRVRARALPDWHGAPARLAEAVTALAALVLIAELLGAAGALRRGWLALACALAGLAAVALTRGSGAVTQSGEGLTPSPFCGSGPPPAGRWSLAAAAGAVALVAFEWGSRSVEVLGRGMADPDTLWYHMPFSARFAQTGETTPLQYTQAEPITTFHPAGSELVHAIGIALFDGYDLLSPFVNLGFAGLALLAGWCAGRRFGAAPHALVGVAVVLSLPIVLQTQPGEAANDLIGVAWLLAAVALLLLGAPRPAPLALAAVAAGMAMGTKLSLLAPVALITLGVLVAAPRSDRRRTSGLWIGALAAAGGFWYLRNLVRVGNPLPWYGVKLGPLELPSPSLPQTDANSFSLAHYATDVDLWRSHFLPGLDDSLGHLWPALLALTLAGALLALATRGDAVVRVLGVAALGTLAAYAITPASAGGPEGAPVLFGLNLRFATPALALGLVLLPCTRALASPARRGALLAALALLLLATQWSEGFAPPASAGWGLLLAAALAAAVAALVWVARAAPARAALAAAALAALLAAAGWPVQKDYFRERYAETGPTLPPPSLWAQDLEGERIGIVGYLLQYPLYGRDGSNRVEWLGRRGAHGSFAPIESCTGWRAAIDAGRYRYVVTAPQASVVLGDAGARLAEPREAGWTASAPGAHVLMRDEPRRTTVFRLDGRLGSAGCRPARASATPPTTVSRRG